MELMFVALGGLIIGFGFRYLLPRRRTHGAILLPAVGVISAAVIWEGLTWLGLKWNGGWIWAITFVAIGVVVVTVDVLVGLTRHNSDERLLHELSGGIARPGGTVRAARS